MQYVFLWSQITFMHYRPLKKEAAGKSWRSWPKSPFCSSAEQQQTRNENQFVWVGFNKLNTSTLPVIHFFSQNHSFERLALQDRLDIDFYFHVLTMMMIMIMMMHQVQENYCFAKFSVNLDTAEFSFPLVSYYWRFH